MKDRIYVCHTFYHVLITFLKEFELRAKDDRDKGATLVLSLMSNNFGGLKDRIEELGFFEEVIEFDEKRGMDMTFADMVKVLHAKVLVGEEKINDPARTACCSDLMSDVLAFVNEKTVLITGLTNPHVLRTADMLDLKCLVYARGKVPGEEILEQAEEQGLVVMTTKETAFTTCGLLYEAGLRGVPIEWPEGEEQ